MIETANKLKQKAEKLVSEIGQGFAHKELHSTALELLMTSVDLIQQIETAPRHKPSIRRTKAPDMSDTEEINKVENRLRLWAKRPHQINHRILKKYLELSNDGANKVTENNLSQALLENTLVESMSSFHTNFLQMKTISEKNHGKVFDITNGSIIIWKPVEHAVKKFKSKVLP